MRLLHSREEPLTELEEHRVRVREARVEAARAAGWTEIPRTRLVERPLGLLVDAETDATYTLLRGSVFQPGSSSLAIAKPPTPLAYFLDDAGAPVFLERGRRSWSEIVARRARKAGAAT